MKWLLLQKVLPNDDWFYGLNKSFTKWLIVLYSMNFSALYTNVMSLKFLFKCSKKKYQCLFRMNFSVCFPIESLFHNLILLKRFQYKKNWLPLITTIFYYFFSIQFIKMHNFFRHKSVAIHILEFKSFGWISKIVFLKF